MRINSINNKYVPSFGMPFNITPEASEKIQKRILGRPKESENIEAIKKMFDKSPDTLSLDKSRGRIELTLSRDGYKDTGSKCSARFLAKHPDYVLRELYKTQATGAYREALSKVREERAEKAVSITTPTGSTENAE